MDKDLLLPVTGLWVHEDKNGEKYFAGSLRKGGIKVLIFKNAYAEKENDPQYKMYFAPAGERRKEQPAQDEDLPF